MGRKLAGPVKIAGSTNWFARLTVPQSQRALAGKSRLIRSLDTADHGLAMRRWGPMMRVLEQELRDLLRGRSVRQQVAVIKQGGSWIEPDGTETPMTPMEVAGVGNYPDVVLEAVSTGEVPVTWDELLDVWVQVKSRERSLPIAPGTKVSAVRAVDRIKRLCLPNQVTKEVLRVVIRKMEQTLSPQTVQQQMSLINSVLKTGIREDLLTIELPTITYRAATPEANKRRAFTDDELKLLPDELWLMTLTGLRVGEYITRKPSDVTDNGMLIVKATEDWRPKTLGSTRRVPLPPNAVITGYKTHVGVHRMISRKFRAVLTDKSITVHSARHTFIELSRRVGCDPRVIQQITGHRSNTGSFDGYGAWPDEVLQRESQRIWDFAQHLRE